MVLLVYGFPSKVAALQFEWAWQNPHLSRQVSMEVKLSLRKKIEGKSQDTKLRPSMKQRIEILREMLGFEGWRRWPLKVAILDEGIEKVWIETGQNEGIVKVDWTIVGEDVVESDLESEKTSQESKRDFNLKKLKTLDIKDCKLLCINSLTSL